MRKWIPHVVLVLLLAAGILWFADSSRAIANARTQLESLTASGDTGETAAALEKKLRHLESGRITAGILLTFVGSVLAGLMVVLHLVPMLAQKATHAVFDSGEMVEKDPMRDARSLVAQGNYEEAVEAFRTAAEKDPSNRLPWVEIYRIQHEQLQQPFAAAETLRTAVEAHPWEPDDAAFFLFRLSELHDGPLADREGAAALLQQVVDLLPQTRHAANATQRLREWGVEVVAPTAPEVSAPRPFGDETSGT
jgi:tetratricopeptide (TPR) repeat protein